MMDKTLVWFLRICTVGSPIKFNHVVALINKAHFEFSFHEKRVNTTM